MGGAKRWASNVGMALSVLALGCILAAWVGSYVRGTVLVESRQGKLLLIGIDGASKPAHEARDANTLDNFLTYLTTPINLNGSMTPPPVEYQLLGFRFTRGTSGLVASPGGSWTAPYWILGIPYWFLSLLAVAFPTVWLSRRGRAARRQRANCCPACSYDLRGNVSGTCPECGTAITPARQEIASPQ